MASAYVSDFSPSSFSYSHNETTPPKWGIWGASEIQIELNYLYRTHVEKRSNKSQNSDFAQNQSFLIAQFFCIEKRSHFA
jgi:hypothetical protein